ncbi:F-box/kelch-repeat protein At3g23880-like [Camellia sinensis]|uniref:F-box associated beta-propeller type 1 domain-containing protein n=1 Tax=Camellia sinensis var. sinensis TaxID=542762 RepID=A0A4S4DD52_CAMSN|nr:F-box/kelch-repeat protein At3g23880-like [Camellia sinensis]THG00569.1 hypothetical protein TEA_023096 [Camellia sinensis var. sinensis]
MKKHLSLVTKDDTINPWRIIIRYPFHKLKSCSLDSFFDGPYGYAVNLNYPLKTLRLDARIGGSCDGLICVYFVENYDDIIYIRNPAIGKHKILPSFGKGFILSISYGVGYDSPNDDCKVVRINNFNDSLEVKIYSLRTDSWRKIQDFPSNIIGFHSMDSGKLVNGSLNWVGINTSDHSWVVTALDLVEETYREIPQPNYGKEFSRLLVWALKVNLCVVCEDTFTFCNVWVVNEYGKKESWTKLVSMTYVPQQRPVLWSEPLWYFKDGEILVNCGGTLVLYDLIRHTVKYRSIYSVPDFHEVETCQESLVSPDDFMKVPIGLNN